MPAVPAFSVDAPVASAAALSQAVPASKPVAAVASVVAPAAPPPSLAVGTAVPFAVQVMAQDASHDEPPPWPGSEDLDQCQAHQPLASASQGAQTQNIEPNRLLAQANKAQVAPEFVANSARVAPEAEGRVHPTPHSTPVPASARYTPTDEGDVWHATVQQLVAADAISALVRELALQSQLVARDGDHWLLRVERESLNQPVARERLRAALEAGGHAAQISVELGAVIDSPARRNAAAAAERQRRAEDIVHNDPFVQSLMRDYGAKIVPGSIKPA